MNAAIITLSVAIATFILQEGITNIIHGIIFRMFSNVHKGDRIEVQIDNTSYTGIISRQTIRHIVINDIQTNAEIIIPNCKIDLGIIKNSYNGKDNHNRYVVELPVSYKDAEKPEISEMIQTEIRKTVNECTLTTEDIPNIYINYKDSYVSYTFLVITNTIEDNFKACSHIREKLMQRLASKNIHIPYNQLDINIHN